MITQRKRFGLLLAGIGAGMSALALLTDSLDLVFIVSSTIMVAAGLILWFT